LAYARRAMKNAENANEGRRKPKKVPNYVEQVNQRIELAHKLLDSPYMHLQKGEIIKKPTYVSHAPGDLMVNDYPLTPFKVTVYSQKHPQDWWKDFRIHHEEIFHVLRIRDLYAERQEYRRQKEEKYASRPMEKPDPDKRPF
jgi:hypothetical protein